MKWYFPSFSLSFSNKELGFFMCAMCRCGFSKHNSLTRLIHRGFTITIPIKCLLSLWFNDIPSLTISIVDVQLHVLIFARVMLLRSTQIGKCFSTFISLLDHNQLLLIDKFTTHCILISHFHDLMCKSWQVNRALQTQSIHCTKIGVIVKARNIMWHQHRGGRKGGPKTAKLHRNTAKNRKPHRIFSWIPKPHKNTNQSKENTRLYGFTS